MNPYIVLFILPLVGNAALGTYVIVKNPKSKVTREFFVLALLLVGWAFAESMMRTRTTAGAALFWSKILYLNNLFLPSTFLALSYVYTGGKKYSYIAISHALSLIFIPFLFTDQLVENVAENPPWGYDIIVGPFFPYFVVLYLAIISAGTVIVLQYYRQSSLIEKRKLQFMLAGFLLALFLISLTNLLSRTDAGELALPRAGSLFTLIATLSFAYGMFKYQLLVVPTRIKAATAIDSRCGASCSLCSAYLDGLCPSCEAGDQEQRESCPIYQCSFERGVPCNDCKSLLKCDIYGENCGRCPFTVDRYGLKARNSYLWEDANPQFAFEVFRDYTIRGCFGLFISRDYPQKAMEKYQLVTVSTVWLSQVEGHERSIDPTNLPRLTHTITQFIQKTPQSFIFLLGLEYLIVHNGFDNVLKHLHMINDQVMTHNSRFLVVVDPKTLDPRELSLLEREMHPLKEGNLFKSPG